MRAPWARISSGFRAPSVRLALRQRAQTPAGRFRLDNHSVTPVLGTILVLGITVVGIAGILVWGAPAIARIQAQNAQLAMVGELEDLRSSAQELSVPDHSRFPSVVLSDGSLSLGAGSRMLITANHDGGNQSTLADDDQKACDFRVTKWADTSARTSVDVAVTGCTVTALSNSTIEIYEILGSNSVKRTNVVYSGTTATSAGSDFSTGDWLFKLTNSGGTVTYAQAWLISTDRITWSLQSSQSRSVYLDGGVIFSETEGSIFIDKEPALGDAAFGAGYVGLWLRTFDASEYTAVNGRGTYQVYLALTGNHLRIDEQTVYKVRYDIAGDLAEAWCNSLIQRNEGLTDANYTEDAGTVDDCFTTDPDGVRSVAYCKPNCTDITLWFEFRLLQAQIYASLIP